MATLISYLTHGDVILQRFDERDDLPAELKKAVAAFRAMHNRAKAAQAAVVELEARANDAQAAVNQADAALDRAIGKLADVMAGEGLGMRRNPFSSFSKYPPAKLCDLAYTTEAREVQALCDAVLAQRPPTKVKSAVTACIKQVKAVGEALTAVSGPVQQLKATRAARRAVIDEWREGLGVLRAHAQIAWAKEPATLRSMFAQPERIQRQKRSPAIAARKKTAKEKPITPEEP